MPVAGAVRGRASIRRPSAGVPPWLTRFASPCPRSSAPRWRTRGVGRAVVDRPGVQDDRLAGPQAGHEGRHDECLEGVAIHGAGAPGPSPVPRVARAPTTASSSWAYWLHRETRGSAGQRWPCAPAMLPGQRHPARARSGAFVARNSESAHRAMQRRHPRSHLMRFRPPGTVLGQGSIRVGGDLRCQRRPLLRRNQPGTPRAAGSVRSRLRHDAGSSAGPWMGRSGRTRRHQPRTAHDHSQPALVHGYRRRRAGASFPEYGREAHLAKTALMVRQPSSATWQ